MDRRTDSGGSNPSAAVSSGLNAPLLIVLGTLALTALLYWPTSLEIADLWEDTVKRRYTHGWLVLAVTVWLIWRDRRYLGSITLRPTLGGWLLVAIGSIGWLVGYFAGLLAVSTLAMPQSECMRSKSSINKLVITYLPSLPRKRSSIPW